MHASRTAGLLGLLLLLPLGLGLADTSLASVLAFDPASSGWSTRVTEPGASDAVPPPPLPAWSPVRLSADVPAFGREVRASGGDHMGEPGVKIAPDGTIYVHAPGFLWVSKDHGATFARSNLAGVVLCGCDADLAVSDLNEAFYSDLNYPRGGSIGASVNQGDTWVPGGIVVQPGSDRQWIESDGLLRTYLTLRSGGNIQGWVASGPAHEFAPLGVINQQPSNFRAGYLAVDRGLTRDPTGYAYFTYTSGNSVRVVVTQLGGLEGGMILPSDHLVADTGGSNLDSFSAAAVDDAGNVYVVWSERAVVNGAAVTRSMMASSTDHGATWSAPVQVEQAPATTVYPWVVAGADGKVGIVYYGSSQATLPGSVTGDWYVYYAYSANAHSAHPSFTETLAVPHKVRTGPICTGGTGCSGAGSRTFLDFFGATKFPDGSAAIAFDDQEDLSITSYPYVHFVQQVGGPKLE